MSNETSIKLFESRKVRSLWDSEAEKWYISIIDVIEVLTESERPRKYWDDLKRKLKNEGSELSEKIGQLKMQSSDGKFYNTDVADVEQLFRLIQWKYQGKIVFLQNKQKPYATTNHRKSRGEDC